MIPAGKRYIWHSSRSDVFSIWYVSDIHWLSRACAEEKVKEDIATITADDHAFWLGGGDYCEFIGYRDNRFDPDSVAEWVPVKKLGDLGHFGMEQIRDLFKPIKHKCLGLLLGNHELKYELATDQEGLHGWLCTELGVANLGYSCLFDLVFCRTTQQKAPYPVLCGKTSPHTHTEQFRVFAHHGAGYAQTPGGKLNRLVQFLNSFEADLYLCGHTHDQVARKEPVLCADAKCTTIMQRQRLGMVAGSYLKTYQTGTTTYGEQRGYRPTSLGAAVATICPETRQINGRV